VVVSEIEFQVPKLCENYVILFKFNKTLFSLAMVVEKANSFGVFVNGTWGGMRGSLKRGVSTKSCIVFK